MALSKFIASQLFAPSGIIGHFVLPGMWNKRNRALNDLVLKHLALQSQDRILEVGFGGGYLLSRIHSAVKEGLAAGVDLSSAMISHFKRQHRTSLREGRLVIGQVDGETLPFGSESFDKVCSVNTIFYLKDVPLAFSELHRVLVRKGKALICFTDKKDLEERPFSKHGLRLFEAREVRNLMSKAGFRDIQMIHAKDRYRDFHCAVGIK